MPGFSFTYDCFWFSACSVHFCGVCGEDCGADSSSAGSGVYSFNCPPATTGISGSCAQSVFPSPDPPASVMMVLPPESDLAQPSASYDGRDDAARRSGRHTTRSLKRPRRFDSPVRQVSAKKGKIIKKWSKDSGLALPMNMMVSNLNEVLAPIVSPECSSEIYSVAFNDVFNRSEVTVVTDGGRRSVETD